MEQWPSEQTAKVLEPLDVASTSVRGTAGMSRDQVNKWYRAEFEGKHRHVEKPNSGTITGGAGEGSSASGMYLRRSLQLDHHGHKSGHPEIDWLIDCSGLSWLDLLDCWETHQVPTEGRCCQSQSSAEQFQESNR